MKQYIATIHFNCQKEPQEDIDWLMDWAFFDDHVTDVHIEEIEEEIKNEPK